MTKTKTEFDFVTDLDDVQYRFGCACRNLMAVHDAMESGSATTDYYADCVLASYLMLVGLCDEMKKLVDQRAKEVQSHE